MAVKGFAIFQGLLPTTGALNLFRTKRIGAIQRDQPLIIEHTIIIQITLSL